MSRPGHEGTDCQCSKYWSEPQLLHFASLLLRSAVRGRCKKIASLQEVGKRNETKRAAGKGSRQQAPLGAFSFGGLDGVQTVLGGVRAYSKGSTLLLPHVPGSLRAWLTALRWFGQREAFTAAQHLGLFRVMTFSSNITRTVIRSCRRVRPEAPARSTCGGCMKPARAELSPQGRGGSDAGPNHPSLPCDRGWLMKKRCGEANRSREAA